jgi:hypothetical protein
MLQYNKYYFQLFGFFSKLQFKIISKKIRFLEIYDLMDIETKYIVQLNDKILLNYKSVKYLCSNHNVNISNLNHMTNLKILHVCHTCGINDDSIKNINLEELHVNYNPNITNVNHMYNLKELHASGHYCGINDNSKITNIHNIDYIYNEYIML